MTFAEILGKLRENKRAVRAGWDSQETGQLVLVTVAVKGQSEEEGTDMLLLRKDGKPVRYSVWKTAHVDVLADDWCVVD